MTVRMKLYIKSSNTIFTIQSVMLAFSLLLLSPMSSLSSPDVTTRPLPRVIFPSSGLGPRDIAVIMNDSDPDSVAIGTYYQQKRGIPNENMIALSFPTKEAVMDIKNFYALKAQVYAQTPSHVQAYALTWAKPFRVGCMSITSAFALGFDPAYCAKGCKLTKQQPYFNSDSHRPFHDFGIRPTMSLAGKSLHEVMMLIDRGVAADGTAPSGTGYLVETNDKARSVRSIDYTATISSLKKNIDLQYVKAQSIKDKQDVLFYFTGLKSVENLGTNRFLPGAIADHLTSAGGMLTSGSTQMSILRWLEAGATGSYGTVIEPCNFAQKFPHPGLVIHRYIQGESLIEAYWKSVAMPGQGIFIGEPLANPFGGHQVEYTEREIIVRTRALRQGYAVQCAHAPVVPVRSILMPSKQTLNNGLLEIRFPNPGLPFCKLIPK